ncbi:hypothetical protein N9937_02065 [bacterium]|nr:hypothetical protein [bacterium]
MSGTIIRNERGFVVGARLPECERCAEFKEQAQTLAKAIKEHYEYYTDGTDWPNYAVEDVILWKTVIDEPYDKAHTGEEEV